MSQKFSTNLRNVHLIATTISNTAELQVEEHTTQTFLQIIGKSILQSVQFIIENAGLETAAQQFTGVFRYLPVTLYSIGKMACVYTSYAEKVKQKLKLHNHAAHQNHL